MANYRKGQILYENPLACYEDVETFIMEGDGAVTFPHGRMRMESLTDPNEGQKANIVYWCPIDFPENIAIEWEFWPIREPGLCILFFAAKGMNGEDIFDASLQPRTGEYHQYHSSDLNAYHISYFRRRFEEERAFHTANLRKSYGFHLVSQGGDPLPSITDATPPYQIQVIKYAGEITFSINQLQVFTWKDDGQTYGPILKEGKIGFRQMAPLIAEYANFRVFAVEGD